MRGADSRSLPQSFRQSKPPRPQIRQLETARELTRKEGIFGGGSSGAAVHVALEHARGLGPDKTMIVLLPDWGGKYISKMFSDEWMRNQGLLEQE